MKVCMVSTVPPTTCGIATYCVRLSDALSRNGKCQVVILGNKNTSAAKDLSTFNSNFKTVRVWKRDSFLFPFALFHAILYEKPHIIHIQHEYLLYGRPKSSAAFLMLLVMLRLLRKPVIITMHSTMPRTRLQGSFFQRYESSKGLVALKKHAIFLVTVCIGFFSLKVIVHLESARKVLIADYKFEPKKIVVIPHGIEKYETPYGQNEAKMKLGLDGKKILLFFGFIRPSKGIETLILAMPRIMKFFSGVKLLIVGNYHPYLTPKGSDYFRELKTLVHELGLDEDVLFVSELVPDEELSLYGVASDLVVFPYVEADIIGASGALSSLLSFGKPVVATRVGRFVDTIDDGEDGLLVPPADSTSLSDAIISLLSNPRFEQKISEKLLDKAEKNSWKNVAQKTMSLYRDVRQKQGQRESHDDTLP